MCEQRAPVPWWVWAFAGIILIGLIAALIIWWQPIYGFVSDSEKVAAWVESLGVWGPVAIILLQVAQTILAPIPGQAIQAVSGYLYGPWWGTLFSLAGMVMGSCIVFFLARRFGRPFVLRFVGKQSVERLDDLVRRGGVLFFFLLWLFPFTPDDLVCVAAGLTPMPPLQFLILMSLGRLPGIFFAVWVGANMARIEPIWWVLTFVAIAVVAAVLWRWGDRIQDTVLSFIGRLSR
jgi:uncharacterized membrane protein YdjX (TVP38/TMEM64 family)